MPNREHFLSLLEELIVDGQCPLELGQESKYITYTVPELSIDDRQVQVVASNAHPMSMIIEDDNPNNPAAYRAAMIAMLYLRKHWKTRAGRKEFSLQSMEHDVDDLGIYLRIASAGICAIKKPKTASSESQLESAKREYELQQLHVNVVRKAKHLKDLLSASPVEQLIRAGQSTTTTKSKKGSRK